MAHDSQAKAIIDGTHQDPFAYLGPHVLADGRCAVRAFLPEARRIEVLDHASGRVIPTTSADSGLRCEGMFEVVLNEFPQGRYRLRVDWGAKPFEIVDPYQFGPWLGEADQIGRAHV